MKIKPDDKWRTPMIKKCDELMDYDSCTRIYDESGNHKLSILRCATDGGFDIVDPEGHVLYCLNWCGDIPDDMQLIEFLIKNIGISPARAVSRTG